MSGFTWATLVATAVVIVPPWSPPAWLIVVTAIMLAVTAVRALNGRS